MADTEAPKPWSNNPYAPQIPYSVYFAEKTYLAGVLISAIFYGIVIVLFFQCMGALLGNSSTRKGEKWGLVAHVVATFFFATIYTAMTLNILSISFIDNREFPGIGDGLPPGPFGYQFLIYSKAISIVPNVMFLLNNWLADSLLLYRCYIIYNMNYRVIAFPSLMYLASISLGVVIVYQSAHPDWDPLPILIGYPYFSVSVALDVLLTLMIVVRLILHDRGIRNATGAPANASRLYKTIITMLVESCALYSVTSLLFIGPWAANNNASNIFLPVLGEIQVIAPFLVIIRVANRSAFPGNTTPRIAGSARLRSQGGSLSGGETASHEYPMGSVDTCGKTLGELGVDVEAGVDLHDKV